MEKENTNLVELTWNVARKLANLTDKERIEIFEHSNIEAIIKNNSANETGAKILAYEKKLEEEKISVGDIVRVGIYEGVVTYIDYSDDRYNDDFTVIFTDGVTNTFSKNELIKTGKKVDILKVLKNSILKVGDNIDE